MTKQRKLRHSEYYDLQECFDELYAKSKDNYIFTNLMNLIKDENNIKLAYRNIKRNSGNLKFDEHTIKVLHMLATSYLPDKSVEYLDNRVSVYASQYGKCAVTGNTLWIDEIHCHHIKPLSMGGDDKYKNLIIIHKDIHILIHATNKETIQTYLNKIKPDRSQLDKINKFRVLAGNTAI